MTIQLVSQKGKESCDRSFAQEVKERSRSHLERCYLCMACSSGCPVAFAMDYAPHQILRMTQLGFKERVLNSTTIWLCASCETCATRCPNDINIVQVMDTLRMIALRDGRTQQTNVPLFHAIFLDNIKNKGKIHELTLVLRYILTSGSITTLFRDMILGLKMILKGRLAILSTRIRGVQEIKRVFQLTEKENRLDHGKTQV